MAHVQLSLDFIVRLQNVNLRSHEYEKNRKYLLHFSNKKSLVNNGIPKALFSLVILNLCSKKKMHPVGLPMRCCSDITSLPPKRCAAHDNIILQ
jgi:hypothetical protein